MILLELLQKSFLRIDFCYFCRFTSTEYIDLPIKFITAIIIICCIYFIATPHAVFCTILPDRWVSQPGLSVYTITPKIVRNTVQFKTGMCLYLVCIVTFLNLHARIPDCVCMYGSKPACSYTCMYLHNYELT